MEDGFLLQFLVQTWRLWVLILGSLGLAVFAQWRRGKNAKEERARKKDAILPQSKSGAKKETKKRAKKQAKKPAPVEEAPMLFEDNLEDDFPISSPGGSIFDDEDFFSDEEDDSFTIQQESQSEIAEQSAIPQVNEPEEEVVDLASLLTGMVYETEELKNYHTISDVPVAVKLVNERKAIGRELLSILRDERDARPMVQIDELVYRTLENDTEAKKTFAKIMKELSGIILNPDDSPPDGADISGITFNKMNPKPIDVQVSLGGDTTAREMISILRDEADAHLIIQIGNTGYRTLVDQKKAKTGFSRIMKELSIAMTTVDDNPPVVPQKEKPVAPPVPSSMSSIFDEVDKIDEVALPGDIRPPKMDDMPDAYKVDRFGRVKVNKVKLEDKAEDLSIADAIEAYLQHKISETPEFQKRGIHIRSAFGGGVRIEVDGAKYEFVDEVEDVEARNFIQEAIAEWQERH